MDTAALGNGWGISYSPLLVHVTVFRVEEHLQGEGHLEHSVMVNRHSNSMMTVFSML